MSESRRPYLLSAAVYGVASLIALVVLIVRGGPSVLVFILPIALIGVPLSWAFVRWLIPVSPTPHPKLAWYAAIAMAFLAGIFGLLGLTGAPLPGDAIIFGTSVSMTGFELGRWYVAGHSIKHGQPKAADRA